MLPAENIFPVCRKDRVFPLTYKTGSTGQELTELIEITKSLVGSRKREVLEQLGHFHSEIPPHVLQGMIKIVLKHAKFRLEINEDPESLREKIFDASTKYRKQNTEIRSPQIDRQNILKQAEVGEFFLNTPPEDWLYSDSESNQILESPGEISARDLADEFNLSQLQGLLVRSENLQIQVSGASKTQINLLLGAVKSSGLILRQGNFGKQFWLESEGPESLANKKNSYGKDLIAFFDFLFASSLPWNAYAKVFLKNRGRRYFLELNHRDSYSSKNSPSFSKAEKLKTRIRDYNKKYKESGRCIAEKTNLFFSAGVLLPDFSITSPEKTIRFEWVHYPAPAFWDRLRKLAAQIPAEYYFLIRGESSLYPKKFPVPEEKFIFFRQDPSLDKLQKLFAGIKKSKKNSGQ